MAENGSIRYLARALVLLLALFVVVHNARAACSGTSNGTPKTQAALIAEFPTGGATNGITPDCVRDVIASTYGTTTNFINLKNLGLPTGGDDTAAINSALASALPATFSTTGSIAPTAGTGGSGATATGTWTVTAASGTIKLGMVISGSGVTTTTTVVDYGTGTGGTGTYIVNPSQTEASVESMTVQPPATAVVYAPAGTYNHLTNLEIKSVCLVGDGDTTVFASTATNSTNALVSMHVTGGMPCLKDMMLTTAYTAARQLAGLNQAVWVDHAAFYTVQNVNISGTSANKWPAACLIQDHSMVGLLIGNKCQWSLADAFHVCCDSTSVTEMGNYALHPGDDCYPVVSYTGDTGLTTNVTVVGNRCYKGSTRGLVVEGGSSITYTGNVIDTVAIGFCMIAASDSGQRSVDHVVYSGNILNNCGTASNSATTIYGTGVSNTVSDITMIGNMISHAAGACAQLGVSAGAGNTSRINFSNNTCDGSASPGGYSAIGLSQITDLTVQGNTIENWSGGGFGPIGTNAGNANISNNTFSAISGGYNIELASSGFAAATVIGNTSNGGSPTGMLHTTTIAAFTAYGNVGGGTQSVAGVTTGFWDNPAAAYTHR